MGCPKCCTWKVGAGFLLGTGTLLLAAGIVLAAYGMPAIIEIVVRSEVQLVEDTFAYDQWEKSMVPLNFHVYVYNITNPDRIDTERIQIEEVGPYVYQEDRYKTDIVFNPNGTVTYNEYKGYIFQRDKSVGQDTDMVYTANVGVLGISAVISGYCDMLDFGRQNILKCVCEELVTAILDELTTKKAKEKFYTHASIEKFVFNGADVPMFQYLAECFDDITSCINPMKLLIKVQKAITECKDESLLKTFSKKSPHERVTGSHLSDEEIYNKVVGAMQEKALSSEGGLFPEYIPEGKFAMLYGSNASKDGPFLVYDGIMYSEDYTKIVKYKNSEYLEFWGDWHCNQVNGTDGVQFPPYVEDEDRLYVFSSDVCRSLYLEFEKDVEIPDVELPAKRFVTPESMMSAANPENECFKCDFPACQGDGIVDLTACQDGAPILMTPPHFYMSNKDFLEPFDYFQNEGAPSKEKHETALDIDYRTGTTLSAHKRIQINMLAKKDNPEIEILQNIKTLEDFSEGVVFPIMWFDETATIDEASADDFRKEVVRPVKGATAVSYILIGIGFVLDVIGGIYIFFKIRKNKKSKQPKLETQDSRTDLISIASSAKTH